MKRATVITWIFLIIASKLVAYALFSYKVKTGIELIEGSYYKFGALHDLLAALLVYLLVKADRPMRIVAGFWLVLASNQMLDELFFDPTKYQFNEFAFFIISLLYTAYEFSRVCKKKPTH